MAAMSDELYSPYNPTSERGSILTPLQEYYRLKTQLLLFPNTLFWEISLASPPARKIKDLDQGFEYKPPLVPLYASTATQLWSLLLDMQIDPHSARLRYNIIKQNPNIYDPKTGTFYRGDYSSFYFFSKEEDCVILEIIFTMKNF